MTNTKGGIDGLTGGSGTSLSDGSWGFGISRDSFSNVGEFDLISGNQVSILGSGYSSIIDNSLTTAYQFANAPTVTNRLARTPSVLDMISNSPTTAEQFANTPTLTDRLVGTPSLLDMMSNSPTTAEQLANTLPLSGLEIDLLQPAGFDNDIYPSQAHSKNTTTDADTDKATPEKNNNNATTQASLGIQADGIADTTASDEDVSLTGATEEGKNQPPSVFNSEPQDSNVDDEAKPNRSKATESNAVNNAENTAEENEESFGAFVKGVVGGDFYENDSWSATGGKILGGLAPPADARDVAAAVTHIAQGIEGAWSDLGWSLVGSVPLVGDTIKAVGKGSDAASGAARAAGKNGDEVTASAKSVDIEGVKNTDDYGVAFFGKDNLSYYTPDNATIGREGKPFFLMPLEDSAVVKNASDAARYTGRAPSAEKAYLEGGDIFGLSFPTKGMKTTKPTAVNAGGWPHYLEGGHTAVKTGDGSNAGYLVNPTREFVVPGGKAVPKGSTLFKLGSNGEWIPVRKF